MEPPVLSTQHLGKRFGPVVALSGVDFSLQAGQIHAICGENGAGKSTLIKTLCGVHPKSSYEGEVRIDGQVVAFSSVRDAEAKGVGVIHQELALVNELTVAENIALGNEPVRGAFVDWLAMARRAQELIVRLGVDLDPETRVGSLGVGHKQLVEILRALGKESRILILDEPTAALSEAESQHLLVILRQLREKGIAILYVSHRLEEVFAISDHITVLRDGVTVFSSPASSTNRDEVVAAMVGRKVTDFYPKRSPQPGEPLLSVSQLSVEPPTKDGIHLKDITFEVRAGEVFGIGGLLGAGRTELVMHLFGAWGRRRAGQVRLRGVPYERATPAQSIQRGLVLVTEDRKGSGLVLDQTIAENLSLAALNRFVSFGFINRHREHVACRGLFERLRVKAQNLEAAVDGLSGGNQQKVALGKALMTEPSIVLLDEPTRGIDVGAKVEIYDIINQLTDKGNAVLLVSSELPELIAMSDRILMLGEGCVGGLFEHEKATPEALLDAAISATEGARRTNGQEGHRGS